MLFHKIQTKATVAAAGVPGEMELKLRILALAGWLAATIILVMLAIYAYQSGWSEGAGQILTIASSIVGSGGLGIILGERATAKEAGLTS
ncbi:MAG: hypothetical protein A7316_07095 [Candidatus Altiarchaeales archaeon WOR_SM1_86-2]|nr:MAG: hypothetical protein A7315_05505 [Candidatus Altiarchaeales archaeon WOR_SM1_79]ODS38802.1 MAG: hypothetical protein A7316_07095 [Candidatus Altiarchaeales archaeon WOR_SM1_86-2]